MRLPFRRRTILDVGPSGVVIEWKIPLDPQATDDEDALVRHFRWLSRFSEEQLVGLMSTRLGSLLFGSVRYKGPAIGLDSLENWEDVVEATPEQLSDEEYEEFLYGDQPLMRRVAKRLRDEQSL
jgi:hypothetical protein